MHCDAQGQSLILLAGLNKIREGMTILSTGPMEWYLDKAAAMINALFDRFAPWKPGDRVELTTTPEIDDQSGWYSSRHFLIAGSRGTVRTVDFNKGLFYANVEFDDESWLKDGKPQPVDSKHSYGFSEKSVRKL